MRVIAQCGTYSVPIDNAILEKVECTVTATIEHTNYLLGEYDTDEEARCALEKLHAALMFNKGIVAMS